MSRVFNLVTHIEGEKQAEDFRVQSAEEEFGLKREKVTGEWRRIHKKKL
jgi:hypothetical protein